MNIGLRNAVNYALELLNEIVSGRLSNNTPKE